MVHGTNGLHVVRIVCGTNSLVITMWRVPAVRSRHEQLIKLYVFETPCIVYDMNWHPKTACGLTSAAVRAATLPPPGVGDLAPTVRMKSFTSIDTKGPSRSLSTMYLEQQRPLIHDIITCNWCFRVDLAVACLGLVVSYKSVFQLLFWAAADCLPLSCLKLVYGWHSISL